ncbi:MAG TPA: efflux transporter outer membrane subunit [Rhodanobacteraceae bacterium]|nr:efflux transporter outer membrane subunit [Rhodanobacteraceae bacterium]
MNPWARIFLVARYLTRSRRAAEPMGIVFRTAFFRRPGLAACALSVTLAACSVAPVPRPDAKMPATWRNAPTDAETALGPAPDLRGWWRAFGDPDLDGLVERALDGNLALRQSMYRVAAARALAGRSDAAFLPEVGAHTFAEPTPDSSASYFQAGFDAKWELGLFGRAESAARIAQADAGTAEIDAEAARVTVVAEVVRVYVDWRAAQRRLDVLSRIADASRRKADLVATRQRLRLATSADAAAAEAGQAVADAALAEPRMAIERCRQQMAVLLGDGETDALAIASNVGEGAEPKLGALVIAEAPADLLRTRPEIRRAELAILKAAGELGIARADLYPRLALGGSLTYSSRVVGHTRLADTDSIVTIGPLIDVPIFDWGQRRAVVSARDAELEAAVSGYRQAVLEGVAEVETAMAALAQQSKRATDLDRAAAALGRNDEAVATLRRVGLADDIDRETAIVARLRADLEAADAERERDLAFVALYKAFGGAPLPPPGASD